MDQNEIKFKHNNEKYNMLSNLQLSLERLNPHPLGKSEYFDNFEKQKHNDINKNIFNEKPEKGKGKKHFTNNQNFIGSYKIDYQHHYLDSNDRINNLIKYYNEINEKEKSLLNSPQVYSSRRRLEPVKNKRNNQINLSPDNPCYRSQEVCRSEEYVVIKFSRKNNFEGLTLKKRQKGILNKK